MPKPEQEIIIKKSNELIQARYKLTKEEQRLILLLASQIHKDDEDFKSYEIRISDFVSMFGLEKRKSIYSELEESSRRLTGRTIELSRGQKKMYASWLSYVEYIEGSGTIKIEFHKSLKPYLLQLKDSIGGFTKYSLDTVMNFRSSYSIRLYELLKMEVWKAEKAGKNQFEKVFSLEEYRQLLGIEKKAYPIFANFRIRVIEPTVREITEQTDLNIFETKYIKTGKTITSISFVVLIKDEKQKKAKIEREEQKEEEREEKQEIHKAIQALIDNGFSFENARTYKAKYGIKQIERNLAYMQAEERNGKKIENRPAYLASAIREDWGQYREAEMKAKAEKDRKKQEAERKALENQTTLEEQIKMNFKRAFEVFEQMEKTKQDEFIFDFTNQADSFTLEQMKKAEKKGESLFSSTIAKSVFTKFLIDRGI
jgi:plasmid replication initiation protein